MTTPVEIAGAPVCTPYSLLATGQVHAHEYDRPLIDSTDEPVGLLGHSHGAILALEAALPWNYFGSADGQLLRQESGPARRAKAPLLRGFLWRARQDSNLRPSDS